MAVNNHEGAKWTSRTVTEPSISVIGCGCWGKNLVRNFAELGHLRSVCDIDGNRARRLADAYCVEIMSFEDILRSEVSGVVIAAPACEHFKLAKEALCAGKNVLVEKPLALELEEAGTLCSLQKEVGKVLMVGHLLQYHTAFLGLESLVQEKRLGRIQYIYSHRLDLGKFHHEESILWNFAPHDFSMILSLVGEMPKNVKAIGSAHVGSVDQDIATVHLWFGNGVRAHVLVSWLNPFKERKLVVVGEYGMAVFDDGLNWSEKLKFYPHDVDGKGYPQPLTTPFRSIALDISEPLKAQCRHFASCILDDRKPVTDGEEGLRVIRVLDAAHRSLCSSKTVGLREFSSFTPPSTHKEACTDGEQN